MRLTCAPDGAAQAEVGLSPIAPHLFCLLQVGRQSRPVCECRASAVCTTVRALNTTSVGLLVGAARPHHLNPGAKTGAAADAGLMPPRVSCPGLCCPTPLEQQVEPHVTDRTLLAPRFAGTGQVRDVASPNPCAHVACFLITP